MFLYLLCIFCKEHIVEFCFFYAVYPICFFFNGMFSSLAFNVILDRLESRSTVFLLISFFCSFALCCFSSPVFFCVNQVYLVFHFGPLLAF